ncbi:enoyl-CoA hydratase/isomerase family protein [Psychrobacter phenylpyruvicus]|uniref:Probable enoyl-CoA hydratase echA8 n=1 Tax=Psychrobacter phenylpyruvicus TaxID=29432 RepID=A0A379LH24_9GAMM|nr:enoyl-CoA hydratase/isomerase family protein [Psychrobacter phenylpyruvicus]SUD89890.1 Probable enoyl-CoA hydratase echA8 [Psychrobacter phenylpyruvicus]
MTVSQTLPDTLQLLAELTTLKVSVDDYVATVTLTRPDKRNAFNDEVIAELNQAFTQLGSSEKVRVIVLAAEGKAFCAGADLNWMRAMADYSREENLADADKLAQMLSTLYRCPKPTIAAIQGDVYAGGIGLISACDIAIAVDSANFCLSEVRLGLAPATISPYVIRAMGARAAHRYLLTAEVFDAVEAQRIGLIHESVAAAELDAKVASVAKKLRNNSPNAVKECKQLVQYVAEETIDEALITQTVKGIADIRASDEGKEGVQSFLQKRKPNWLN